ncbi:MAG: Rpp14/Pop5 family protein [Candidatus Bathyarchaeota archaeon]|nr:Rpp14/Pop5 family protein [Candidatus Termiticorpusculum sp.]MCL2867966.1 Rpp14/Pop5 family protein [Candidatus Termiticorpusculum sp.]
MKRVKRRYLALQVEMEGVPSEKELMDAIWGSVTRLYGEVGASLTSMALINFDVSCKIVVVRTSLETLDFVRASLACIIRVAGMPASVHVLAVSGTIKALLKHF